ncbi:uncharacterized protein L969DRAFT_87519 [Mixia osmundae IAM 14324]|uniref:Metallo-beta-lactamase domain-containing protein n=1 Tax=Mixia osmundae (strain CBS 9802 / IAM 14324 / JCM 22182 / KY 12970) TaxID=764103 RepID=G7DVZ4_MIXOS|nr:uncharacterized protein L969DRAFT_87519 [Mixia osmundae IAM 14324]KEI39564.1 hypothetical protein L969DRAFT_87519 [Mixia osmundae IAM 14324]GAA94754.1 hypothetical protein E5Q_01408 [Mixia osmundae IAM 14324]
MATSDWVIRSVAPGVTIFSKPFARGGFVPIGGRSTAIKLASGNVFLFASTPYNEESRQAIEDMATSSDSKQTGTVKWVLAPDSVHTMFTKQWQEAYPDAKIYGCEDSAKNKEIKWTKIFTKENPNPFAEDEELSKEIKSEYFSGFVNQDIAVLHMPSKTLVVADLLMNLPATEQYSKSNKSAWGFTGYMNPFSGLHKTFVSGPGAKDKDSMAASAKVVNAWDFTRIIPCHGDVLEGNGRAAWSSAYSKLLKP